VEKNNKLIMTIPFYTENIQQPLQQMLYDADANVNWSAIIQYCEPLIDTAEDDGVILCYTFALMEEALAIHVDDVESTSKYCLELLRKLKHTYGGTDHWKRMINRHIKEANKLKQAENALLKKPISTLSKSEKSKLAYNLSDKGGIENYKIAAELHKELIELNKGNDDESYHYANYISCLYQSNQLELADEKFDEFLTWTTYNKWQHYSFMLSYCFQDKIIHYKHDAIKFQQIWDEAMKHDTIKMHDSFPLAYSVQDELLIAANELGLMEIKQYLIIKIKTERKPREINAVIKIIMET
jgi:tetratricopeptide (TPR) repeat protein